jgi:hypothetical protein
MKQETPAQRYRRQATECGRKAEKANGADRAAWQRLAEDWTRLAQGADANPRLNSWAHPSSVPPAQRLPHRP